MKGLFASLFKNHNVEEEPSDLSDDSSFIDDDSEVNSSVAFYLDFNAKKRVL